MVTLGDLGGPAQDGTARGHHSEGGGKGGMVWSTRTKSFRHVRWRCGMVRVSAALDWQGGFNSDNILKIEEVTI
uniref:Uncharacterized protein n=1 Tax=Oryza nivara TaxID=4536 RepID=A0A0E0FHL8_ORYNI